MKKFLLITSLMACMGTAFAADKSECVDLVKKAAAFQSKQGQEKLVSEVNNPSGSFKTAELYLFVNKFAANPGDHITTLAHGANPKLVGKDMTELKDAEGVPFIKKMNDIAASKEGKGWLEYKWTNPQTKDLDKKTSYVEKVGEVVVGCGIYK